MVYSLYVELGRVVFIAKGKQAGKVAAIVDVVDGNRVLLDGPSSGVPRGARNLKDLQLTKFLLKGLRPGARGASVKKAAEVTKAWEASAWHEKLVRRQKKAAMTDFDRFKLMKAKQMRNQIVRAEMNKLKKSAGGKKK